MRYNSTVTGRQFHLKLDTILLQMRSIVQLEMKKPTESEWDKNRFVAGLFACCAGCLLLAINARCPRGTKRLFLIGDTAYLDEDGPHEFDYSPGPLKIDTVYRLFGVGDVYFKLFDLRGAFEN